MNTAHDIIDFDEWSESNDQAVQVYGVQHGFKDLTTARFLKESFSGFMKSPVAMFKGLSLEAKTLKIEGTIDALLLAKEYFVNLKKNDDLFLYDLIFVPAVVQYVAVDLETFQPVQLDTPKMSQAHWRIRFANFNGVEDIFNGSTLV